MPKLLGELAKIVSGKVQGDETLSISGLGTLKNATKNELSFYHNVRYRSELEETHAGAVIISASHAKLAPCSTIIVDDPYYAFAQLSHCFAYRKKLAPGIHPTALVNETAYVDPTATVGPYVVIEEHAHVGAHTKIDAHGFVGAFVKIGQNCQIDPRVTLYHHVKLEDNVVIGSGSVIGSEGFGNAMHQGKWHKISQLGSVKVCSDVDIGANTTIDRGALGDTQIGTGVRLDNLIQIGHNVEIGDHTAIAACTGIAGSTKIGRYCMIGGGAGISGHIELSDKVMIVGMSSVPQSIKKPGAYASGTTVMPLTDWKKNIVRFRQLDKITRLLKKEKI